MFKKRERVKYCTERLDGQNCKLIQCVTQVSYFCKTNMKITLMLALKINFKETNG